MAAATISSVFQSYEGEQTDICLLHVDYPSDDNTFGSFLFICVFLLCSQNGRGFD